MSEHQPERVSEDDAGQAVLDDSTDVAGLDLRGSLEALLIVADEPALVSVGELCGAPDAGGGRRAHRSGTQLCQR